MKTINIIMGPSFSGKKVFANEHFPNYAVISLGDYQRHLFSAYGDKYISFEDHYSILLKAQEKLKDDLLESIVKEVPTVMLHTLYMRKRRMALIKEIRTVTNAPIDIYLMQPSDEQILAYIEADTERSITLEVVKSELRQIETPSTEEGFAHVYAVTENGVQDWSNIPVTEHILGAQTEVTYKEVDSLDIIDKENPTGFGEDEPFLHICECCGRTEVLTAKEGYENGWDMPGKGGIYPESCFGVITPRTCGNCSITDTLYWQVAVEKKPIKDLEERHLKTLERILQEPEILRVKQG